MNAKHLTAPTTGGNGGVSNTSSLGRTTGQRTLQRIPSHESLATHPLLSPHTATFAPSPAAAAAPTSTAYVPYTPRTQRPSSAPPPPEAQHKLQLVSLKSAAQGELGLDPASVGWHLLERLIVLPDWAPPRSSPILLLPVTRADGRTDADVRDHVALQRGDGWIQTLSGLIGRIDGQTLSFVRAFPGAELPANVVICPAHPKFTCARHSDALPLPPPPPVPPPLPPRPTPAARSGLTLGGLSLFGRRAPSPAPQPASPAGSVVSLPPAPSGPAPASAPATPASAPPTHVPAYTLSRPIVRAEIIRQLAAGARQEATGAFLSGNKPDPRWTWLSERVSAFVVEELDAADVDEHAEEHARADALADRVCALYDQLEDDIRAFLVAERTTPTRGKRRRWGRDKDKDKVSESEGEKNEEDPKKSMDETRKSTDDEGSAAEDSPGDADDDACARALVAVERAVCRVLWDRMFVLETAEDEAFASRVAALHMAELSLGELGVDVGGGDDGDAAKAAVEDGVESVVSEVGRVLAELDKVYTPSEKCRVFVDAHRAIVDGLSRLPPLKLKPDTEERPDQDKDKDRELELEPIASAKPAEPSHNIEATDAATEATIPEPAAAPTVQVAVADGTVLVSSPDGMEADAEKRLGAPVPSAIPPKPTPVSSDLLLPVLIYAIVRANPSRLPSHLAHIRRFQCSSTLPGEATFCAVSMLAGVQYIETAAGEGQRSRDEGVGPMPPSPLPPVPASPLPGGALRRVLSGAVDALGIIRGTLRVEEEAEIAEGKEGQEKPVVQDTDEHNDGADVKNGPKETKEEVKESPLSSSPWNAGLSALLRRDTSGSGLLGGGSGFFSREGVFGRSSGAREEELAEVPSRPGSVYPGSRPTSRPGSVYTAFGDDSGEEDDDGEEDDEEDEEDEDGEESGEEGPARSIRSFESMMSSRRRKATKRSTADASTKGAAAIARKSLSDRLATVSGGLASVGGGIANVSGLAASFKGSPPPSRRSSLLPKVVQPPSPRAESPIPNSLRAGSPSSLRPGSPGSLQRPGSPGSLASYTGLPATSIGTSQTGLISPSALRLAPPRARFMTCTPDDLRLVEVAELLRDYRRIVEGVRNVGGFVGDSQ
ncbi:hypothetical protein BD626DRAFT_484068 [Schizophyllum amplum]|uniref:VPS9 domain-containing protein n=1 Tax=Schizophyllum amplum TaxID=97359 RepID=A0A550CPY9_9AGAR|nr:hypothetical protein BD626DRAFT_484068 [Auriculariopsis ampla]